MLADVSYLDSRYSFDEQHGWAFSLIHSVAVAAIDGRPVVVTGCGDGGVRVIDMIDGRRISEFVPEDNFRASAVAVTELQGHPVAVSGHANGSLRMIDMAAGTRLREWHYIAADSWNWIAGLVVVGAGDRTLLAAIASGGTVRFWDLADGTLAGEASGPDLDVIAEVLADARNERGLPELVTPTMQCFSLTSLTAAELSGRPVVVAGYGNGTLCVVDLESGNPIWDTEAAIAHSGLGAYIDSLAVCEFGGRPVIAAGGSPGMIGAWDLADGSVVVPPFVSHQQAAVRGVAIADYREHAVMAAAGFDLIARIWDAQSRALLDESQVNSPDPLSPLAAGRPEGRLVIVTGVDNGLVRAWRPKDPTA